MLGGCRLSGLVVENLDIFKVWHRALLVYVLLVNVLSVNMLVPRLLALCWLHVG